MFLTCFEFLLFYSEKTDPPGGIGVEDYDMNFVKLKWERPKKDGGNPPLKYVIQGKEKKGHEWKPVSIVTVGLTVNAQTHK